MTEKMKWDGKFAQFTLESPSKYDLMSSVHAWVYPEIQPVPEITENGALRRIFSLEDKRVPLTIFQATADAEVEVRHPSDVDIETIRDKVRFILGFDVDIEPAIQSINSDDRISYLAEPLSCLRPYTADTPFEGLIKCILQQQISFRAANVITRRLVTETFSPTRSEEGHYYGFPNAHDIITLGSHGLRNLGVGYKTDYVLGVSSIVESGELNLEELKETPHNQLVNLLRPIRGIGEWTINAFAISSLHDFSVFPYSDLGVRNLLGCLYGDGSSMKTREVKKIISRWGSSASLVVYLLMCADVLGLVKNSSRSKKP